MKASSRLKQKLPVPRKLSSSLSLQAAKAASFKHIVTFILTLFMLFKFFLLFIFILFHLF